jgi:uncharacterized protein (TIGR00288 family)
MEEAPNIAIFCDFENVAIGVKDARYDHFDINLVLGRLLDKGNVVVKKAYADWERYRSSKRPMHEAAFEMIEIPHLSYSGKNSADIRMVVDALDLCYTKSHVDVFVVISGDSDFSPLVSKLRENNKKVIGLGVKKATSDLLVENCDEFIYYDDLVRHKAKTSSKRKAQAADRKKDAAKKAAKKAEDKKADARKAGDKKAEDKKADEPAAAENGSTDADQSGTKEEAIELLLDTVEALFRDRDDNLWGSHVKQTIKRKKPNFAESYYGYRSFNQMLEDARGQGLLELQKDDKSGGYLIVSFGPNA